MEQHEGQSCKTCQFLHLELFSVLCLATPVLCPDSLQPYSLGIFIAWSCGVLIFVRWLLWNRWRVVQALKVTFVGNTARSTEGWISCRGLGIQELKERCKFAMIDTWRQQLDAV